MPKKAKQVYLYLSYEGNHAFQSIRQLSRRSGIPYRSLQRRLEWGKYCDPRGRFEVMKLFIEMDDRQFNKGNF